MTAIPAWVDRYTRIPFVDDGFDEKGCHCWGLIRLVLEREAGIIVPKYSDTKASQIMASARKIAAVAAMPPPLWHPVSGEWKAFDVIVLVADFVEEKKLHRVPGHVGIAVTSRHLLHVELGIDSVCVRRTDQEIAKRLIGAYRHEGLT